MKIRLPASSRRMAASRDRELAGEFFVFLSRFEYALKRTPRYLKGSKSRAQPDWERFGADLPPGIDLRNRPTLPSADSGGSAIDVRRWLPGDAGCPVEKVEGSRSQRRAQMHRGLLTRVPQTVSARAVAVSVIHGDCRRAAPAAGTHGRIRVSGSGRTLHLHAAQSCRSAPPSRWCLTHRWSVSDSRREPRRLRF